MFTHPVAPNPPGLGNPAVSVVSGSQSSQPPATRPSRLRGLSYLRNYTQTHILGHSSSTSTDSAAASSHSHAHAPPSPSASQSPSSPSFRLPASLFRADSDGLASASSARPSPPLLLFSSSLSSSPPSHPSPRSLVPTRSHPLGQPPLPAPSAAASVPLPLGRRSTESSAIPSIIATAAERAGIAPAVVDTNSLSPHPIMTRARSATTGDANGANAEALPSIRFSTFYDPRAPRPSLGFAPVLRTLPTGSEIIRVGRYSERDSQPNVPHNVPSAAPVGFKSKVVSRRHCEFWYEEGKWYIKDVKSSSGTFLNHIRLSPPGTESKPFPVNDGDIVQLGIDFKGGEEMIFRCVKMRLELNRGWQNKLNTFNMTTHKRLRNMTASSGNAAQSYSQDCSICLNSIAPCQCLFVAPCSHTWHYKCIRTLLNSASFPIFICPNCRAATDLEAEVEDPEEWEQLDSDEGGDRPEEGPSLQVQANAEAPPRRSKESVRSARREVPPSPRPRPPREEASMISFPDALPAAQAGDLLVGGLAAGNSNAPSTDAGRPGLPHASSNPMPIPSSGPGSQQRVVSSPANISAHDDQRDIRTPSPTGAPMPNGQEGPITPRNDAGPWVFDGSGVRMRAEVANPSDGAEAARADDTVPTRRRVDGDIS
ncbi:hypothetical protein B0H63DRAFT_278553 [Podospora didyma]|uniref:RING-type E3 ubiquitin transferase n=1 Tax=Podospora didyma TaxID=330526 RepID=A0AAE0NAG6_9PEZI|nr:hypothetical protein B0H63DRAFT_278553 [Podospora didyma]